LISSNNYRTIPGEGYGSTRCTPREYYNFGREWNKIDATMCQNLIESRFRRVAAVVKAKEGYQLLRFVTLCFIE